MASGALGEGGNIVPRKFRRKSQITSRLTLFLTSAPPDQNTLHMKKAFESAGLNLKSPSLQGFSGFYRYLSSLPLDRAGGFRGDVVGDAVDAFDLVDDPGRDAAEELHVEGVEIRRHAVDRGDGAQCADPIVGAAVAHHANGLDRQEHREGLPDVVVEAGEA